MNDIIALLTAPFIVRALIAAILTGMLAPAMGVYIVQRQMSMLGDGLGHLAIAGVGLALVTGTAPLPLAMVVCVLGAIGIEWARTRTKLNGDLALAVLFYGGLATGVVLAGKAGAGAAGLSSFLFGSLTSVTNQDLWIIGVCTALVLGCTTLFQPQLIAVHADPEMAQTQGLNVGRYNTIVMVAAALTVAISLRTVGVLLVASLMVIPVGSARNITFGFARIRRLSVLFGVFGAVVGMVTSVIADSAPGATTVLITIGIFVLTAFSAARRLH
ncbi:metal ABC transporter permease [Stomatohabitans albus]|uniref:metal ABC transporter permease n=1 Tax=Stomatohabitans albus TaxID=3110766 RepID=UPI00300D2A00